MKAFGIGLLFSCAPLALACSSKSSAEQRILQPPAAATDALSARIARGRYLVETVAGCGDCHSPKNADGSFNRGRWLSGMDCFVDAVPDDPALGCVSTRNLTDHPTGLRNRSDQEIEDMLLAGRRPDGKALHPWMPYPYFANMRPSDTHAIVAYLRTVPGVDRTAAPSQPPFLPPAQPAPPVPEARIPMPRADYPERTAALRGRYLAGNIGSCLGCHTPRGPQGADFDRAFQGGMKFDRVQLGLPASYPDAIYSANLTPHATGLGAYSIADIVRALKYGEDRSHAGVCRPMPAGPNGDLGGLTDADATDIAHYLKSLPPAENRLPNGCTVPEGERRPLDPLFARLPTAEATAPFWLSATGLYTDIARKQLAPDLHEFVPAYPLWSDGSEKRRFLRLPPGTQIDTRDMDHWQFPVGSVLWKEFSVGGRRIETRLIARTGSGPRDYWMGAFVWNDDESDARFVPDGLPNARGSGHDVPKVTNCSTCHAGEPGRVLGFSAVQQPNAPREWLSAPASGYRAPGDARAQAALGYLHANCGHCHNQNGSARPDSEMDLRLSVADRTVAETGAARTALGVPLRRWRSPGARLRIAAGSPDRSGVLLRMRATDPQDRMPPLGTREPDAHGTAQVKAWIEALPVR